jgi:hypothetical protein
MLHLKGNWFEELALKSSTGVRFYPSPKVKESTLLTNARVIVHTDQMLAKDYKSTTSLTILDPQKHPEFLTQKDKAAGPRLSMREERIKAKVDAEFDRKKKEDFEGSRQRTYTTSTNDAHGIPGFTPFLDQN